MAARQARSVETRARLLRAASEIIAEHGIEGASVDAIAERAERTSGSLYGQFGSKDGLIVALLDASIDVVAEAMFADIEAARSLDGRLAALWRNFASPPAAARDWVQFEHEMWVWANRPGHAGARARLAERYQARFAALADALDEWTDEGLLPPLASSPAAATMLVGALLGLEMVYRLTPAAIDEGAVVSTLRGVLRSHETGLAATADAVASARPGAGGRHRAASGSAAARRPRAGASGRPSLAAVPSDRVPDRTVPDDPTDDPTDDPADHTADHSTGHPTPLED